MSTSRYIVIASLTIAGAQLGAQGQPTTATSAQQQRPAVPRAAQSQSGECRSDHRPALAE